MHVWRRHTPLPVDLHDADLDLAIGILRQLSRHRPARSLKLDLYTNSLSHGKPFGDTLLALELSLRLF